MTDLAQSVALVTGSTKGIGYAIAEAFTQQGARVIIHGRDPALIGLSRGLAELTKGTGVTVNSLLPGPTWTAGVESYFDGLSKEENKPVEDLLKNYFSEHEPNSLIQRFITVKEIADAAVFLAGNGAVNGSALRVEGGIIRSI